MAADVTEDLKRGLLRELAARLSDFGSSHESIGRRLRLARPEVTAIMTGTASRFTLERILRLLRRCGCEANIDLAAGGRGGMVRWERLLDIGLEWLPLTTRPGLTLIGGTDENVRRSLLTGILREHVARGDRTVLYCQRASSSDVPTVRFEGDHDVQKLIGYHSDADLPQQERFGARVAGIDSVSRSGASPWTVMHFAKGMRVYATVNSLNGCTEAQRAVDEFSELLGPPYGPGNWHRIHEMLDTVIVPRACYPLTDHAPRFVATLGRAMRDQETIEIISDGHGTFERLVAEGLVDPVDFEIQSSPLKTENDACTFLMHVSNLFDSEFAVIGPKLHTKKDLEIIVRHRGSTATVSIAASWSSVRHDYGIVFVTDEPDSLPNGKSPTTFLGTAPTDAAHLVRRTTSFLKKFDAGAA